MNSLLQLYRERIRAAVEAFQAKDRPATYLCQARELCLIEATVVQNGSQAGAESDALLQPGLDVLAEMVERLRPGKPWWLTLFPRLDLLELYRAVQRELTGE